MELWLSSKMMFIKVSFNFEWPYKGGKLCICNKFYSDFLFDINAQFKTSIHWNVKIEQKKHVLTYLSHRAMQKVLVYPDTSASIPVEENQICKASSSAHSL